MNVLKIAQKAIKPQTLTYKASTRTLLDNGLYSDTYTDTVVIGNIQPIQKTLYEQMGLDLQKTWVTIHISMNVIDVRRNVSGDLIVYQGETYQLSAETDWFRQRGFVTVLGAKIDG